MMMVLMTIKTVVVSEVSATFPGRILGIVGKHAYSCSNTFNTLNALQKRHLGIQNHTAPLFLITSFHSDSLDETVMVILS